MLNIVIALVLLYLLVGFVWFILHVYRVRKHDLARNTPIGDFRSWEWPLVFVTTVLIWPVAVWYYVNGRPERA